MGAWNDIMGPVARHYPLFKQEQDLTTIKNLLSIYRDAPEVRTLVKELQAHYDKEIEHASQARQGTAS